MNELTARLPETDIQMLTNERRFGWPDFTEALMTVAHPRLILCIPVMRTMRRNTITLYKPAVLSIKRFRDYIAWLATSKQSKYAWYFTNLRLPDSAS